MRSARVSAPTSLPSTVTAPSSGGAARGSAMIVVVLPQPDSPTSPSVSPSRMSKLIPSTAVIGADPPAQDRALGERVALGQVAHLEHGRPAARAAPRRGRPRSRAAGRPAAPWISPSSISSLRWQAATAAAARRSAPASARPSSQTEMPHRAARRERAAPGRPATWAGEPSIGVSGWPGRSSRGTEPSRPIVYGIRGRRRPASTGAGLHRPCRRT